MNDKLRRDRKTVKLENVHYEILDKVQEKEGLNDCASTIRFIILNYDKDKKEIYNDKIEKMSKEVSITKEMIATFINNENINEVKDCEDTLIYHSAKDMVNKKIQKNATKKSGTFK